MLERAQTAGGPTVSSPSLENTFAYFSVFIFSTYQRGKYICVLETVKAQCKYIHASPSVPTTFKRHMSQCTNYIEVKAHCRPGGRAETTLEWHHWEQESPRPTECEYSNLLDENE